MQYSKNGQRYSQQSYSESTIEIVPLICKVEGLVPLTWRNSCQYFRKWLINWWFVLVLWGSPHFSNHPKAAARPSIRKKNLGMSEQGHGHKMLGVKGVFGNTRQWSDQTSMV